MFLWTLSEIFLGINFAILPHSLTYYIIHLVLEGLQFEQVKLNSEQD